MKRTIQLLLTTLLAALPTAAAAKPLKVFILAGQSNNMTDAEQKEYLKMHEAEIISPKEDAKWKRGASNAGYNYLGCTKTFALMGKAFAEATLTMMKEQKTR
jgi:hypothetical protein